MNQQLLRHQGKEFYSPFVRKRTENWCRQDTLQLIYLWKSHVRDLKGMKRNYHVYQKVAEELSKHGVKRSAREVKTKIANLAADYRKEQCKIRMGAQTSAWKFWKEVDEIFALLQNIEAEKSTEVLYSTPLRAEPSISILPLPSNHANVNTNISVRREYSSTTNGEPPVVNGHSLPQFPTLSISDVRSIVKKEATDEEEDDEDSLKILDDNSCSYDNEDNSSPSNAVNSVPSPPKTTPDADNHQSQNNGSQSNGKSVNSSDSLSVNDDVPPKRQRPCSPNDVCQILRLIFDEQRRANEQNTQANERSYRLHVEGLELQKRSLEIQGRILNCVQKMAHSRQRGCYAANDNNLPSKDDSASAVYDESGSRDYCSSVQNDNGAGDIRNVDTDSSNDVLHIDESCGRVNDDAGID